MNVLFCVLCFIFGLTVPYLINIINSISKYFISIFDRKAYDNNLDIAKKDQHFASEFDTQQPQYVYYDVDDGYEE